MEKCNIQNNHNRSENFISKKKSTFKKNQYQHEWISKTHFFENITDDTSFISI